MKIRTDFVTNSSSSSFILSKSSNIEDAFKLIKSYTEEFISIRKKVIDWAVNNKDYKFVYNEEDDILDLKEYDRDYFKSHKEIMNNFNIELDDVMWYNDNLEWMKYETYKDYAKDKNYMDMEFIIIDLLENNEQFNKFIKWFGKDINNIDNILIVTNNMPWYIKVKIEKASKKSKHNLD